MKTPKSFADILSTEFRWPRAGDKLFKESDRPHDDAVVGQPYGRLLIMAEGYKDAADRLVERVKENPIARDFLVYPIVFCYRQYLELMLKYFLQTYGRYADERPNWKTHKLDQLWLSFKRILAWFQTPDLAQTDATVAACVAEFAKIDPDSFSFRYPTDTKGDPLPLDVGTFSLDQLYDVMEGIGNYFTGTDGLLSDYVDSMPNEC